MTPHGKRLVHPGVVREDRPHPAALAAHSGYSEEYVTTRFENIVAAARRAEAVGGGVLVRWAPAGQCSGKSPST